MNSLVLLSVLSLTILANSSISAQAGDPPNASLPLPAGEAQVAKAFGQAYQLLKTTCPSTDLSNRMKAKVGGALLAQNPRFLDPHFSTSGSGPGDSSSSEDSNEVVVGPGEAPTEISFPGVSTKTPAATPKPQTPATVLSPVPKL